MTDPADDDAPDIVARLRTVANTFVNMGGYVQTVRLINNAADEIERLRRAPVPGYEVGRIAGLEEAAAKADDVTRGICAGDYVMGGPALIGRQISHAIRALIAARRATPDSEMPT